MTATSADYITRIEVKGLRGIADLDWELQPDVNILSGQNGSGKTTLIRALSQVVRTGELSADIQRLLRKMIVTFNNGDVLVSGKDTVANGHNIDIISTFDNRLKEFEDIRNMSGGMIRTELDLEIYRLQKRYLSYQLSQGKKTIELLTNKTPQEEIDRLAAHKTLFFDKIDGLFAKGGKQIDREAEELRFHTDWDGEITAYQLSSGEKQLLLILGSVLTENNRPSILLMDEPEISLHFDWQCCLIQNIRELNPRVQIIMSTHSPAIIMNGWMGHVTEINDLILSK